MSSYNQQSQNSITARKWYTDIDLNITPHPSSGDLVLKYDKEAIKRSIRNIMLTNDYERPFKPNFGANLRGLLFELADDITRFETRQQIQDALNDYEPRVSLTSIDFLGKGNQNTLHVSISYGIIGVQEPQEVEIILERIR